MTELKFSKPNSKISWPSFSISAGWSCPGANSCLAKVHRDPVTGARKLVDGKAATVRCFSATAEAQYEATFDARRSNFDALRALRSSKAMADLILASLPKATTIRIHVSGDFFSQRYFDAWVKVARARPGILFYAYTKSLPFWIKRLGTLPDNLVLTASVGGRYDHLIAKHKLRYAAIVFSEAEAEAEGLTIDHDDTLAADPDFGPFALLLHGTQAPGSEASKALVQLRKKGWNGYSKATKANPRKAA